MVNSYIPSFSILTELNWFEPPINNEIRIDYKAVRLPVFHLILDIKLNLLNKHLLSISWFSRMRGSLSD